METREKDLIDEIHERRTQLLAQFGNNLERYAEYLCEREQRHPERIVDQFRIVASQPHDHE